jgi:hypothetical protein
MTDEANARTGRDTGSFDCGFAFVQDDGIVGLGESRWEGSAAVGFGAAFSMG